MQNMLIKDIMSSVPITVSPYDNLLKVDQIFESNKFHHLPVTKEEKVVGIVSSTDLERAKCGQSLFKKRNEETLNSTIMEATLVGLIMTTDIRTISSDITVYEAYRIMKSENFRSLIVMDNTSLLGIVTPMDFLDLFFQNLPTYG